MVVHCALVNDQPCHKEGCLDLAIQAIGGLICLRNLQMLKCEALEELFYIGCKSLRRILEGVGD